MLSLIVALVMGQVAPDSTVQWRNLSNRPGWQGYGPILPSGWVDPVKFRRTDNPGVEYRALGREAEFVPSAGVQSVNSATNVAVQQPVQSALVASVAKQVALVAKQVARTAEQVAQAAEPLIQVQQSVQVASDPYGFTVWLNATRARYGLPAVGYDPSLSSWAAMNSANGFGHTIMGYARRQNVGMGLPASVWPSWLTSPAHAAALLDPTIRWFGIAYVGGVWTFNGY